MKLLSPRELQLWHALKHLGDLALAPVSRRLESETRLSAGDYAILSRLDDSEDRALTQKQLQSSLGWDKTRLSHQLTRMEARGLLRRKPAKVGRETTVTLLTKGRHAISVARPVHAEAVRELVLRHVAPGEVETILAIVERLRR